MQNKRGISQAFSRRSAGLELRRATVFDVFDISRIVIQSITLLCTADHKDNPDVIANWTANKTPEHIRGWIEGPHDVWLILDSEKPAGIGGYSPGGEVSVLYIAPAHIGKGIGSALLSRLEADLKKTGHETARLDSTMTARGFYLKQGWQLDGAQQAGRFGLNQKMLKSL